MTEISRRTFLTGAGLVASGTLLAKTLGLPSALAYVPGVKDFRLTGKLHIIGLNQRPADLKPNQGWPPSVITSIDLASGAVRQNELTIKMGHVALPLGNGRLACIAHHTPKSQIVDMSHKTVKELYAPEGYRFGGHAYVDESSRRFIVPVKKSIQKTLDDKGLFLVYDLDTLDQLDRIESAGLHPHEIRAIPGKNELAVTHYGDIDVAHSVYRHNTIDPKLTIYDAGTLKEKRSYSQKTYNAMLTHMSVTPEGHAYCVLTQYVTTPDFDQALSFEENKEAAVAVVRDKLGKQPDFKIVDQGVREGRVGLPLPFLKINTQTGQTEEIMSNRNDQIRSQSVACNQETSAAIATYYFSDTLVIDRPGQDSMTVHGKDIGIEGIRGVAEIEGTPLVAVSGSDHGCAILDTLSLDVIAKFTTDNRHAPHIEYELT